MSFFKKKTSINEFEYKQIINSISYLCIKLNYSLEVKNKAIEIVKDVVKKNILSDKPAENAAAAVYISYFFLFGAKELDEVSNQELERKIAQIAGITEDAFKQQYIKIAETVNFEIILPSS